MPIVVLRHCPESVVLLQAEISRRGLRDDDAIFVLDDGRPLTTSVYRKVWGQARAAVLEAHEIDSPRGRTLSALRDACIAAWLKNAIRARRTSSPWPSVLA
ncbi:hypothetical protein [Streptomyces chartreusis]|uniref:hypothetical protein n=1 Tax=Streptomyces chartreusis TaxID=1969 RepID=UPI00339F1DDD